MKQTENNQNHKKESTPVVGNKPNGKSRLNAQAAGLQKLSDMAPSFLYQNGKLITRDAGAYTPGNFWGTWWQGTSRLGTPFNDIRPWNIGANGIIFDPAKNPTACCR
jgi:hypothetical protein